MRLVFKYFLPPLLLTIDDFLIIEFEDLMEQRDTKRWGVIIHTKTKLCSTYTEDRYVTSKDSR